MPDPILIHTGLPSGYAGVAGQHYFYDHPMEPFNNPFLIVDPHYTDIDFFTVVGQRGIYLNNVLKPSLSLEHCTAYFIQSAFNSVPINLSLTKDVNNNSLSSFLTYYVSGSQVDNYSEYSQKFVPSELTYIKFKCTYKIPATAVHYFVPGVLNSGNTITVLATENVTNFVLTSSTGFMVVSCGDYEFFIGRYRNQELLVNCRSEYLGTSESLPPVTSWRLPLSSHLILPSIDNQNIYLLKYNLNFPTLCSSFVTLAKY